MDDTTTGADLRRERTDRGAGHIFLREIAAEMGVTVSRVSNIEREAKVSAGIAERYRAALVTCRTRVAEAA